MISKVAISTFLTLCLITLGIAEHPILFRSTNVQPKVDADVPYRLPNNTRPISYDVSLSTRVDIEDYSFTGQVIIRILAVQQSNNITLHARQLNIISAGYRTTEPNAVINNLGITEDPVTDFLILNLVEPTQLTANTEYDLIINFDGALRTDNAGFYRSSYLDSTGNRRWLATTQFESTDARHGFPCYDEPALKATFTIRITHGALYSAISNMPGTFVENGDLKTTTFDQTVPMSTYLVAYIVSDFISISNSPTSGIPHQIYARPTASSEMAFSLDAGEKILNALSSYVDVPYTLPKMDQVAVPDFNAGAMENWGLVTYRESALLWNDDINTYTTKTSIMNIISHEFVHQWFGNLVSPTWWTYIWLNEGFAQYLQYIGVDQVVPEWRALEIMIINLVQNVLVTDSGLLRPMTHYVEGPEAISDLFDNVAYSKAGSVIRMFHHVLGDATFRKGLNLYLLRLSLSDATQEDLFSDLDSAARTDNVLSAEYNIQDLFSSWSTQGGYPVLTVERNYENGNITISQERFLLNPGTTPDPTTYWIPINYATRNNPDFTSTLPTEWLARNTQSRSLEPAESLTANDWIIFNKQQTGFYRVQYDDENYHLITEELLNGNHSVINLINRAQIIDDLFNFGRTNRVNYDMLFDLIRYLEHETEYVPWASATNGLNFIDRLISGGEDYYLFKIFLSGLLEQYFTSVDIEDIADEPHITKYSRTIAINWACKVGLEACLTTTSERVSQFIVDDRPIHQNVRGAILCGGLRNGTMEQYLGVYIKLISTTDSTLRSTYINALGCSSGENELSMFLRSSIAAIDVSFTSSNERASVFSAVYQNSQLGLQLAVDFLANNTDDIQQQYGNGNLRNIVNGIAQRVNTAELRTKFGSIVTLLVARTYIDVETAQAVELILNENFAWIDPHRDHIFNWLNENVSGSSVSIVASFITIFLALFVSVIHSF